MTGQQSTPGVLVLYPVKFAGATPNMIVNPPPPSGVPVEGLPHSSFSVVTKRDGSREGAVQAIVDPPADPYRNIALYMKSPSDKQAQLIERRPVDPADPNKQVVFYVFQSLLTNGVHVFFYEVERDSGNSGPSTEYWALYYRELPGGNDVPGNGPHPSLSIQFDPQAGDNPTFGKDEVDKGVPLTLFYSFMEPYDKIILEIGNQRFEFILQSGEVGRPYVIVVTRPMFEQVGSHPAMPFSFTVVRQTNDPTDKRRWSAVIKAHVDTARNILGPAILSEDPRELDDVPETVDLRKLKDFLFALIYVIPPAWESGDKILMSYRCVPPTGSAETHNETVSVSRLSFQYELTVPAAKVLKGGVITVTYEQERNGKVIGLSRVATAQVIGEPLVDEPAAITTVTDTKGQVISHGGETADITANVVGTGEEGKDVELFDGATSRGTAKVINGFWRVTLTNLAFSAHSLTVKALYGSGNVSAPRSFTKIHVEDFETIPTTAINVGGTISTSFFDIFYASGLASNQVAVAPATIYYTQGEIKGQSFHVSYKAENDHTSPAQIQLRLKVVCSRVSFVSGSVSAPTSVRFYNPFGVLLGTRAIPHIPQGSIYYRTDFSAAGISLITLFTAGGDWSLFDSFRFYP